MEIYGVRGTVSEWIKSYLSNRKQYVVYNNTSSEKLLIKCGVPQGSILGPLLFILYINDLWNISEQLNFILFADDTNLFYSNKSIDSLVETLNKELETLILWFKINKLSLNVAKTNYLIFGKKSYADKIKLFMQSKEIMRVSDTKFLGVLVDERFSWKKQIEYVENKMSKGIGIMYRVKSKLDKKSLHMLYVTLILPYLNYCSEIWGNTYDARLKRIITLQKRAIRIIEGLKFSDHTSQTFAKYKCLKFKDIVELKNCIQAFKASKNELPCMLQKRYARISQIHNHKTRCHSNIYVNKAKTNLKNMCPSVRGIKQFNCISKQIKSAKTIHAFKRNMKKKDV